MRVTTAEHDAKSIGKVVERVKSIAIRLDALALAMNELDVECLTIRCQQDLLTGLRKLENFTEAGYKAFREKQEADGEFAAAKNKPPDSAVSTPKKKRR